MGERRLRSLAFLLPTSGAVHKQKTLFPTTNDLQANGKRVSKWEDADGNTRKLLADDAICTVVRSEMAWSLWAGQRSFVRLARVVSFKRMHTHILQKEIY